MVKVIQVNSRVFFLLFCFLPSAFASPSLAQTASSAPPDNPSLQHPLHHSLRILDQWKLIEGGSWGHLRFEEKANLLYIPRTGYIAVLDTATGKEVGTIQGFVDARAVALDEKGKFGYATDMTTKNYGFVRVFDRSTWQVVATITVGRIPSAIIFDPVTQTVFAFSTSGRNAAVIDPATNTVVATIPLPGKPHLAVSDEKGSIYVSFRGIGKLVRIDTASRAIASTWSTDPCAEFHGITFDAGNHQILGSCYPTQLVTIDAGTGQVTTVGTVPMDATDLALDPKRHMLYSGSNSGVLRVYAQESALKYTLQEELPTAPHAGTLTLDAEKGRIFLVTSDFGPPKVKGVGMDEAEAHLVPIDGTFRVIVAGN
jgi:DNA-binding beta-propeller fold protein YncE